VCVSMCVNVVCASMLLQTNEYANVEFVSVSIVAWLSL